MPRIDDQGHIVFALSVSARNFNIGHTLWIVSERAFIFHMCIPCVRPFFGTSVKATCQGQISRSHFKRNGCYGGH